MFGTLIKNIGGIIISLAAILYGLHLMYKTQTSGTVELANAPGVVTITREDDTEIAHIKAENFEGAAYGQGFAHAQTRLWQLQMTRLVVAGRMAEFFGSRVIFLD